MFYIIAYIASLAGCIYIGKSINGSEDSFKFAALVGAFIPIVNTFICVVTILIFIAVAISELFNIVKHEGSKTWIWRKFKKWYGLAYEPPRSAPPPARHTDMDSFDRLVEHQSQMNYRILPIRYETIATRPTPRWSPKVETKKLKS